MTLHDYLAILRRSWAWVLSATVIGALLALGASLLMTPIYQAQAQMFVSVKSAGQVNDAYSGGLFVQQRVKSYVDVVDSPNVLDPVIKELDLNTTNVELAKQVSAQTPPNTVLLNVTVTDPSSKRAADIANAVAASYAAEIKRLEGAAPQSGKNPPGAEPRVTAHRAERGARSVARPDRRCRGRRPATHAGHVGQDQRGSRGRRWEHSTGRGQFRSGCKEPPLGHP
jgi:uncharacterized protein involved in exopolysaccharide biosynthesis